LTKPEGRGPPPGAVVVGIGDELLLGHTINTNGAWLGRELSTLGLRVVRQEVVGDVVEEIQGAVRVGLEGGDVVLLTGGLGPTPDDLTRPAVASLLEAPLVEDPTIVEELRARFRARGYGELPRNNRLMAQIPRGSVVLANPVGAAPGLVLPVRGGKAVVLLPGIPGEMRGIFSTGVAPFLKKAFGARLRPVYHRTIHTTGIPESLLAREMEELVPADLAQVSMAFLPDMRGVRVRLSAQGLGEEEAEARFDDLEERFEGLLRPYRYRAGSGDLAQALGEALNAAGVTLATAESCTGGLISKRITDVPGASRYFLGGVVAYSDEVKVRHLGIARGLMEADGSVSRSVAEGMALSVAARFGADAGIGVTGVAGPGGGSEEKPVGTVWYAVALNGQATARREIFLGDRDSVRERAAQAAMALLLARLEGRVA
jgi:nicotinamide-nucleotide amidase